MFRKFRNAWKEFMQNVNSEEIEASFNQSLRRRDVFMSDIDIDKENIEDFICAQEEQEKAN